MEVVTPKPRISGLTACLNLTQGPQENHCRPAVDVLFRTASQIYGPGVLGIVMTGMGSDGLNGARMIRQNGGTVLAQDQASSAVWGMPGAVTQAGLAQKVLPMNAIAPKYSGLATGLHEKPLRFVNRWYNHGYDDFSPSKTTDYSYLRSLVFSLSQNVLDPSRDYLFETRLAKLCATRD